MTFYTGRLRSAFIRSTALCERGTVAAPCSWVGDLSPQGSPVDRIAVRVAVERWFGQLSSGRTTAARPGAVGNEFRYEGEAGPTSVTTDASSVDSTGLAPRAVADRCDAVYAGVEDAGCPLRRRVVWKSSPDCGSRFGPAWMPGAVHGAATILLDRATRVGSSSRSPAAGSLPHRMMRARPGVR